MNAPISMILAEPTALAAPRVTDIGFIYTTSTKTDVTKTFAKYGWTPPDRETQHQLARALNQFTW